MSTWTTGIPTTGAKKVASPTWLPAVAGIAGDIIGGLFGDSGQRDANRMNLKIAREQMDFQERMSSTAYQRAAEDLEKAGLNRILALGSPASSPAGARATMQSETAGRAEAARRAAHSAMALRTQAAQIGQIKQQTNELISRQRLQNEQSMTEQDRQYNIRETTRQVGAAIREIQQRTRVHSAQADIQGTYAELYNAIGPALVAAEKALPWAAPIIRAFRQNLKKGKR